MVHTNQQALQNAGYNHKLVYQAEAKTKTSSKRLRSKGKTWFNPLFSKNVKTNVGAEFLKLVTSCFPKGHPLNAIFNRNTLKISYRTTANMSQVISRRNKQTINKVKIETPCCQAIQRLQLQQGQLAVCDGWKVCPG